MARVVGIDHLVLSVGNFARSKDFYRKVLGFLGFKLKHEYPDMAGWSNGKTLFWIAAADAKGKKHKYRKGDIGFHHYAFELASRKDVDALGAFLVEHGMTVVDPPGEYYEPSYYAVYFTDPDGMKLEGMVFKPPPKKRRAGKKKTTRAIGATAPLSCPGRVQRARCARAERDPGPRGDTTGLFNCPSILPCGPWVPGLRSLTLARPGHNGHATRAARAQRTVGRRPIHDVKQRSVVRSRGALLRPGLSSIPSHPRPEEGWAERRQAHYLCCRVCETRRIRASEARRVP